jgi:mono/diheme cytochrome c family protein
MSFKGGLVMSTPSSFRLRPALPVIATVAAALTWLPALRGDAVFDKTVRPFIEDHCTECHDADSARAGFRIDTLDDDFAKGNTADLWKQVSDNIISGKMPPKRKPRPDAQQAAAVTSWVGGRLVETERAAQAAGGRVPIRRLNRVEYANTVRDLFSLEEGFARRIEKELPSDGNVGGFDRGAVGLFMDEAQLDKYVDVADMVLDEGVFLDKPQVMHLIWENTKEKYVHGIGVAYRDANGNIVDGNPTPEVAAAAKEPLARLPLAGLDQYNSPQRRYVPHGPLSFSVHDGGVEYLSGGNNYRKPGNLRSIFFTSNWGKKGVTRDGWYRLRVSAGAFSGDGKEALKQVKLVMEYCYGSPIEVVRDVVIDAPLDKPAEYEFLVYLQYGGPDMNRQLNLGWDNGDKDVSIRNPLIQDVEMKPSQIAGEIERAIREKKPAEGIEAMKKASNAARETARENRLTFPGPMYVWDPKLDIAKRPRLWIGTITWDGPLLDWPPKGRNDLFFAGEGREDESYLREIFARFLPRAYRRHVAPEEIDAVVDWALKMKAERQLTFAQTVREGVKNVLCSPGFLYIGGEDASPATGSANSTGSTSSPQASSPQASSPQAGSPQASSERSPAPTAPGPQPIDDWQLASRLSYFLWSSTPDEPLYQLAAANKLHDPGILREQVKRMIADPKASEFVRSFAGQWLGVRNFDNGNPPNRDFYHDYDDALRDSSKREPLEFFNVVLKDDLPLLNFLDSDFLVVNERLAKHYGIDGVEGEDFRRVPAPADDRRGGVLGMAGILTYLADGTRTLPVRRATWVLDTFWDQPVPPPPPNAGDLPAIKDKHLSVRERLEQHRNSENCASCHGHVDSFGLALENYDAIGQWRDRQNGEGMRGQKGDPALDVSGHLPDGREFKTVQEFKAALLAEKDAFVRGFAEKILCYALGRPITYGDHLAVDEIISRTEKDQYRLQEVIQAVVASPYFQTR